MKRREQKNDYRVGVGASSILLILVVLAMTALALLSYGSARNTEALTARNVEMTIAYYEADAKMQSAIAAIDSAVAACRATEGASLNESWMLEHGANAEWAETSDGLTFSMTAPAGADRVLSVSGVAYSQGEERCRVTSYMLRDASAYEDDYMMLLGME